MPDSITPSLSAGPRTVAVLGAGPVGLAAAAHLLERGLEPVVLEAGPHAGHAVRQWGHVPLFSPWRYVVDGASERLLAAAGWNRPQADAYPTGAELVAQYLEPLATRTPIAARLRTGTRVVGIGRAGFDKMKTKIGNRGRDGAPFEIRTQEAGAGGDGAEGRGAEGIVRADAVIDATGTWFSPNPAGAGGLPAPGEAAAGERIAYGMPDLLGRDRARYAGRTVAVLGGGHSAIGTLLDLARLQDEAPGTEIVWLLRNDDPARSFGGGAADQLAARGALGTAFARLVASGRLRCESGFRVGHIGLAGGRLRIATGPAACARQVEADELVVATGFRPDLGFLRELRVALDPVVESTPALAPLIDPNLHSCGTVRPHGARELAHPEPGFYIAGMKSYGRAPTFLMMTGYEQVRSIAAELAGDHEAARRVELVLPETGVCSGPPATAPTDAASACCGPAPAASGCGPATASTSCGAPTPVPAPAASACCAPKAGV